ncbi:MAG: outer membrane beta-barrel protein, partial [Pseudomonadota bacterium]
RHVALAGATAVVAAVSLTGFAGVTHAADLNFKGSIKDDGAYIPSAQSAARWYVRLDGSYANHDDPILVEQGIDTLTESSIENTWTFGGGIGVYFTDSLRGDLTYERRFEADVRGDLNHPNATLPGTRKFGLKSDLFLANMYYDFDNRSRFTPYIGAGLGFVRHTTTKGTVESCGCVTGEIAGKDTWHVAAALMAGAQIKLFRGLSLDTGYRFLYLGEAETGAVSITDRTVSPGVTTGATEVSDDPIVEDLHAHEFRIGLRYDFH